MDNYIDNEETQKYGPGLRHNLERAFQDSPEHVQTFVAHLIEAQKAVDERMEAALHARRQTRVSLTDAAESKAPELENARRLLSAFFKHLGSKIDLREWSGSTTVFFPKGLTGVGKSGATVKAALTTALGALERDETVPDRDSFLRHLRKASKDLAAGTSAVSDAAHSARKGLSEQSEEKLAWLREYRGNALIVEGLLMREGRASELAAIVPHMSVNSGGTRGEEVPDEEPVVPPEGESKPK